jgi:hypothetical protein
MRVFRFCRAEEDRLDHLENLAMPLDELLMRDIQILLPHAVLIATFFVAIYLLPW